MEFGLRAAGDHRGGSAVDESSSPGARKARRISAEVGPLRSQRQTLPRNNCKTTQHKPPPGLNPRQGQLLKDRGECNHASHNKGNAGHRLQPSHFPPRSHLPPLKLNAMIILLSLSPYPPTHLPTFIRCLINPTVL